MMHFKYLLIVVIISGVRSESTVKESTAPEEPNYDFMSSGEIIVSKDNLVPLLRTIILAFTQKNDQAYTGVVQATGNQLYKLAQKHVGDDKHLSGFLKLIKKTVNDFSKIDNLSEEKNKELGDLAEQYLRRHKFNFQFPESILLHQAEMEKFVQKDQEVTGRSEKTTFDFTPYIDAIRDFSESVKVGLPDLSKLPKMPEMPSIPLNLDRIGTAIDEYLPSIRSGALSGVGLSAGSLGMLAAAGILMTSAPFVLGLGGIGRSDDEDDFYYTNRRVSGGRRPLNQYLVPPPIQEPQAFLPAWMQEPEPQSADQFQSFHHQQSFQQPEVSGISAEHQVGADTQTGSEHDQYLQEYNDWVEEYQKALREGQVSEEAQQYYHQYKEWFANYYRQQFGEDPPADSEQAPNVYSSNSINNIVGMVPPPPPGQDTVAEAPQSVPQTFVPSQEAPVDQQVEESNIHQQSLPDREPTSNFQVIAVDDEKSPSPVQTQPTASHLVQQSPQVPSFVRQAPVVTRPSYQQATNQPLYQNRLNQQAYQTYINQQIIRQQEIQKQQQQAAAQQPIAKVQPQYRPEIIPQRPQTAAAAPQVPRPQTPQTVQRPQFVPQRPVHVQVNQQNSQSPKIETGFRPLAGEEHPYPSTQGTHNSRGSSGTAFGSSSKVIFEASPPKENHVAKSTHQPSPVTSSALRTEPAPTPASATTPTPVVFQQPKFETSVRVVTSKSVVTSAPFVKSNNNENTYEESKSKKRMSLDEILRSRGSQFTAGQRPKKFEAALEKKVEEKEEPKKVDSVSQHVDKEHEYVESENRRTIIVEETPSNSLNEELLEIEAEQKDELPVYALDPFYGPRLSRIDVIFSQLSVESEGCRQQAVCNIYKNPNAFTPLSDYLSRQLTVTVKQLKRPVSKDERIIRFFSYLQAARAGQDGYDCAEHYKDCTVDTAKLSYKPIVDAYNKVSVLMNSS